MELYVSSHQVMQAADRILCRGITTSHWFYDADIFFGFDVFSRYKARSKILPRLENLENQNFSFNIRIFVGTFFFDTGKSSSVNQMESYPVQPPKRLTICQRILDVDAEKTLAT